MARGNESQGNAQALHRAGAGCSSKTHTKFRLLDKRILAQAQSRPTTSVLQVPRTCGRGWLGAPNSRLPFEGTPRPPRPGPYNQPVIRRKPDADHLPARPRAPPRPLCLGPERAPRAATPFSRRDCAARWNWAAGMAPFRLVRIPSAGHTAPALFDCTEPLTAAAGIPQPSPEWPRI